MFVIVLLAFMTIWSALGIVAAYRRGGPKRAWIAGTIFCFAILSFALWHLHSDPAALTRMPPRPNDCYVTPGFDGDYLHCPPKFKP
jgi:hypothetical protein